MSAPAGPVAAYHEPTFDIEMRADGPVTAGKPATASVVVRARGEYHCNDQYPYKFRPAESPGIEFARAVFAEDAVKQGPSETSVAVAFTSASPGDRLVRGVLSFSLCSAERCLMEKRELGLAVAVASP